MKNFYENKQEYQGFCILEKLYKIISLEYTYFLTKYSVQIKKPAKLSGHSLTAILNIPKM